MVAKAQVLKGRDVVDAYRTAHEELYWGNPHAGIPEEHTPLLELMLNELSKLGFNAMQDFFDASEELNIQELGFKDRQDFDSKATEADFVSLEGKWQ